MDDSSTGSRTESDAKRDLVDVNFVISSLIDFGWIVLLAWAFLLCVIAVWVFGPGPSTAERPETATSGQSGGSPAA